MKLSILLAIHLLPVSLFALATPAKAIEAPGAAKRSALGALSDFFKSSRDTLKRSSVKTAKKTNRPSSPPKHKHKHKSQHGGAPKHKKGRPARGQRHKKGSQSSEYPFDRVVAFGDSLSDNGNGSYAHGVASIGHPNDTIYGHKTWTNGPVAVSYLVDMLNVPLAIDYAFGGAQGGSKTGATINVTYTYSEYAPDGFTQIKNYTQTSNYTPDEVAKTLHFLWIGNNDISLKHLSCVYPNNYPFGIAMAAQMVELVQNLVDFGAEHIFVPGLYAKHLSPSWRFFTSKETERANLGTTIATANKIIGKALAEKFGDKVIFYDVFERMVDLWDNHLTYGIKFTGDHYCDGHSKIDWTRCVVKHLGNEYYWMQYIDMTTEVHNLIAQDMHQVLQARFGT